MSPLQRHMEQTTGLNWLFTWRGISEPPEDLLLVTINQQVAENLGYPKQAIRWPRQAYATLLNILTQAGARLVVFDISFQEQRKQEDKVLAKSIAEHGNVVLFKYLKRMQVTLNQQDSSFIDIEQEILPPANLLASARGVASFTLPRYPTQIVHTTLISELSQGEEMSQPLLAFVIDQQALLPVLSELIKDIGGPTNLARAPSDKEIVHYSMNLYKAMGQNPKFAYQLWLAAQKSSQKKALSFFIKALQTDKRFYINYYGPPGTLTTIPMDKLLQAIDEPDKNNKLHNKVIYIGFAEPGQTEQQDAYRTVFTQSNGVDLSGVEISATVFANLLTDASIQPLSIYWSLLVVLVFISIPTLMFFILPVRWALFIESLLLAAYGGLAWTLFKQNLWLPLTTPLLALVSTNIVCLYLKFSVSKKRQQYIQRALSHYLPDDIAKALSFNIDQLEKRHQLVQGVCLMTDIHGYSRLSESLSPMELHRQLNQYYAGLIEIVNKYGGSVSNIVGDSLLAIWTSDAMNAALCEKAVISAKAMIKKLNNDQQNSFPTSIALHCGEFSLGNLGASSHFEFSPVGDIVNTTSRIEHLNRDLGTQILCSEEFAQVLKPENVLYRGQFEVHNKDKPVRVYEIL